MQVLQKQAQKVLTRWLLRSPCNFLQIHEIVSILPCLPCLKYQQLEVHLGLIFLTCLATTANSSLKLRGLYSNSRKCGKWNGWLPPHTWGRAPALGVEIWTRGPRRVENSGLLERKVGSCGLAEYGGTRMWERFIVEAERIPKQLLKTSKAHKIPARSASFHPKGERKCLPPSQRGLQQTRFYYKCYRC